MAISPHRVAVNAAFLSEVKQAGFELKNALDVAADFLNEVRQTESVSDCCIAFQAACVAFEKQVLFEETYGYVTNATRSESCESQSAHDRLVEHRLIYAELLELSEKVSELTYRGFLDENAAEIRSRFACLMDRFSAHERSECKLIESKLGIQYPWDDTAQLEA